MPLTEAAPVATVAERVGGWGGGAGASVMLVRPLNADDTRAAVDMSSAARRRNSASGVITRGMGRSYGDAAQLSGGYVIDMTGVHGFKLDKGAGTVMAQSGVTIGELLATLIPAGWILPVVPGTQHVTVGGAIASDIHGKNHPSAGSFGQHVSALGLLTAGGEIRELEPGDELFAATIGGMGLTGVIVWARIRLERVGSGLMAVDTDRVRCLDDALAVLSRAGTARHRVAWLDLLAPNPGRGIVNSSDHMTSERSEAPRRGRRAMVAASLTVPERWPAGVLRAGTVRALNELRYRRAPRRERGRSRMLRAHMFPLDSIGAWPRLYGRDGLLQYQFAVPRGHERVLDAVIAGLSRSGVPCFLATLKALGGPSDGQLSFPLSGWTLALDLPRAAAGVDEALDSFDVLVAEAGGRVYLTKDARLAPSVVKAMYPRLADWQAVRDIADPDGIWRSDLGLRTGLIAGGER